MNNAAGRRKLLMEVESSSRIASFMKREFGFAPSDAYARMDGDILTIHLTRALTPTAQIIAKDVQGAEALRCVYTILYKANRRQMEEIVSRVTGSPTQSSQLDIDLTSMDITVCFQTNVAG